jgi:predicted nucleotidyltransferase
MTLRVAVDPEVIARFCHSPGIRQLAVFGSALRPDFRPASDLDLLVECEPGHLRRLAFFSMEEELAWIFGRRVDLNTPGFLSRAFRDRVLTEAEPLYVQL